jgi:hypothetical protein
VTKTTPKNKEWAQAHSGTLLESATHEYSTVAGFPRRVTAPTPRLSAAARPPT